MKTLRTRLLQAREQLGLPWEIIERDYILSWILAGIAKVPVLKNTIVFKGGTALKKCIFGDYRMSEDLDFSRIGSVPSGNSMEKAIEEACEIASSMLDEFAPIEIFCERYIEREPHPGGQEAFNIRAKLPWQRQAQVRVMIEITTDEPIIEPPVFRPIIHSYGENINFQILTYSLEEIIAEKLRAILQQKRLLEQRGWVRSRARDYYDLWRILNTYKSHIRTNGFAALLHKKCDARQVYFKSHADFFPEKITALVEQTWQQWLKPLVKDLPDSKQVINDLKDKLIILIA